MLMTRVVLAIAACLLVGSGSAAAQQLQARPVPTELVESFFYQSPSMGERYAINVTVPMHAGRDISPTLPRQICRDIRITVPEFVAS